MEIKKTEIEKLINTENYDVTRLELYKVTKVWKIESFYAELLNEPLKSTVIYLNKLCNVYAYLHLVKKMSDSGNSPIYSISFCSNSYIPDSTVFDITCSFFDPKNKLISTSRSENIKRTTMPADIMCTNVVLKYSSFTIVYNISYGFYTTALSSNYFSNIFVSENYTCKESNESLSKSMKLLINDDGLESPDLLICTKDNYTIKVHSSILETAGASLESMINLKNDKKTLSVPIDRVAVVEMIRFIYSGEIQNVKKVVTDLFDLGHILNLNNIKSLCELYFRDNISIENVVDIYILANKWNENDLKTKTLIFMKANYLHIFVTEKFKNLKLSMPDLEDNIVSVVL